MASPLDDFAAALLPVLQAATAFVINASAIINQAQAQQKAADDAAVSASLGTLGPAVQGLSAALATATAQPAPPVASILVKPAA